MDEDNNVFYVFNNLENPFEENEREHRSLPKCETVSQLHKIDVSSNNEHVSVKKNILDEFLTKKFNINGIYGFMEIYSKFHIGQSFWLPVPQDISVIFKTSSDPYDLAHFLGHSQSSIITSKNRSYLNLHNNRIYRFTLIRANFDIEQYSDLFYVGYHYDTEKFHFLIKSSIQFDLTVLYQEKTGT